MLLSRQYRALRAPPLASIAVSMVTTPGAPRRRAWNGAIVMCEPKRPHSAGQPPLFVEVARIVARAPELRLGAPLLGHASGDGGEDDGATLGAGPGTLVVLDSVVPPFAASPARPATANTVFALAHDELPDRVAGANIRVAGMRSRETVWCGAATQRGDSVWLDAVQLAHAPHRGSLPHAFAVRERVSGAVFTGGAVGDAVELPRLGLQPLPFPPALPPLVQDATAPDDVARSTPRRKGVRWLHRMARHLRHVQRVTETLSGAWDPDHHGAALVLVHSGVVVNEGREFLRGVHLMSRALLDACAAVEAKRLPVDGADEAAMWQHCFCKALDMHLRGAGSVAALVDVLNSQQGGAPSPESVFMSELVARWAPDEADARSVR
jgi:hypothetical protein